MRQDPSVYEWRLRDARESCDTNVVANAAVSHSIFWRGGISWACQSSRGRAGTPEYYEGLRGQSPSPGVGRLQCSYRHIDSSGLGKLRHLETHILWVQEKVRTGAFQVRKVRGDVNPAELFTKHPPTKDKIHQLVKLFVCEYRSGRSAAAPLFRPQEASGGKGGQPSASHMPAFHISDDGSVD